VAGVIAILTLICLGLTYSRGAWLALFIALVCLGWGSRRRVLLCGFIVSVFLFVFYPTLQEKRNVGLFFDRTPEHISEAYQFNKEDEGTMGIAAPVVDAQEAQEELRTNIGSGRIQMWQEAIAIIRTAPALGTGLNTYTRVAPQHKIHWGGYAHNCYLQMTAEIGLIGLFSFLWIIYTLFSHALKSVSRICDPFDRSFLIGLLAGLVGFLIHSFFDTNFYSVKLANLMWIAIGAVVVVQRIAFDAKKT
jgi:O-antigen ligase